MPSGIRWRAHLDDSAIMKPTPFLRTEIGIAAGFVAPADIPFSINASAHVAQVRTDTSSTAFSCCVLVEKPNSSCISICTTKATLLWCPKHCPWRRNRLVAAPRKVSSLAFQTSFARPNARAETVTNNPHPNAKSFLKQRPLWAWSLLLPLRLHKCDFHAHRFPTRTGLLQPFFRQAFKAPEVGIRGYFVAELHNGFAGTRMKRNVLNQSCVLPADLGKIEHGPFRIRQVHEVKDVRIHDPPQAFQNLFGP